jgi:hypothetical protein
MNRTEALTSLLQVEFPDKSIEKEFTDAGLNMTEIYTKADEQTIGSIAINLLQGLLSTPDVSEGDQSIRYDRKMVMARLSFLSSKYEVETVSIPTVKSAGHKW